MKILTLFGAAVVGSMVMVTPVRAATYLTESFSFTGSVYSVAGKFTYDQSNGQLQSISGNVVTGGVTEAITGLVPADYSLGVNNFYPDLSDPYRYFSYDNLFVAGVFTFNGVLFSFGSGNYGGLYYNPEPFLTMWLPDGPTTPASADGLDCPGNLYCPGVAGTLNFAAVSPVPEISSWAMMLLGFLGIGILGRAVRRSSEARRQLLAASR
ncbi:hypothetical protein [Bradyrhizobium sp. AS23.2]|uniref:hypothetical protein n=1 Tax=Bradyrhizobium sp. AS23.2 TaxID=1680155 RepID=UPI000B0B93B1|nr:hypothetical protein [Bradyrhizobium sp. AS23.2]